MNRRIRLLGVLTIIVTKRLSRGASYVVSVMVMGRLPGPMMMLLARHNWRRMRMHSCLRVSGREAIRNGKRRSDGKNNDFSRANLHIETHYEQL